MAAPVSSAVPPPMADRFASYDATEIRPLARIGASRRSAPSRFAPQRATTRRIAALRITARRDAPQRNDLRNVIETGNAPT